MQRLVFLPPFPLSLWCFWVGFFECVLFVVVLNIAVLCMALLRIQNDALSQYRCSIPMAPQQVVFTLIVI